MKNKNNKKIGIILISVFILLLLLFGYMFFVKNQTGEPSSKTEIDLVVKTDKEKFDEEREAEKIQKVYTYDEGGEAVRTKTEDDFKALARNFAELFGSYSNHANYDNIESSKVFMSKKMKTWADSFLTEARNNSEYSGEFYGIISEAKFLAEVESFNPTPEGQVVVRVATKRTELQENQEGPTIDQDIVIKYVYENNDWLVDEAIWQ